MSKPGADPSSGISSGDALILPERHPACRRREAQPGSCTERENLSHRCQGRSFKRLKPRGREYRCGAQGELQSKSPKPTSQIASESSARRKCYWSSVFAKRKRKRESSRIGRAFRLAARHAEP